MATVEIGRKAEAMLKKLSATTGKSAEKIVREAVARYLEDLIDGELAMEVLKNPGRIWTLEEIERGEDLASAAQRRRAPRPEKTRSTRTKRNSKLPA